MNSTNKNYKINFTKNVGAVAVFLSLIPWFSFGLLSGDSMPWPFIGYIFFFLSFKKAIIITPKNFIIFFSILIFGVSIALVKSNNILHETTFRSLYNYFGVVIFYLGFFNYLLRYGFPINIFISVNILWLLFAILEIFFPDIALIFTTIRTSSGRGITSLAPEPTFFGMYLFFSSWLIIVGSNYKPSKYSIYLIYLNLISILLIAKASMIILYLFFAASIFIPYQIMILKRKRKLIKNASIIVTLLIIGAGLINHNLPDTRFVILFNKINNQSLRDLFFIDQSLNSRLEHLVYSVHGAVNNLFIPAGFDAFIHNSDKLDVIYNYYFWYSPPMDKIMSWSGDWLFQLGIFGFIFISYLFYNATDGSRIRRAELFLLAMLLFSAIPIAFPLIAMLLAFYAYQYRITASGLF